MYLEVTGQMVSQQMDLGIIDDTPLFNLPAAPWTMLTGDSEIISHLISSFATWDANALHFFDMDIFLEGMEKEDGLCKSPVTPLPSSKQLLSLRVDQWALKKSIFQIGWQSVPIHIIRIPWGTSFYNRRWRCGM